MYTDFFLKKFIEQSGQDAIIWKDKRVTYRQLLEKIKYWDTQLESIEAGDVVALKGDFSPETIAIFLVLVEKAAIIVPLNNSQANAASIDLKLKLAQAEWIIEIDPDDRVKSLDLKAEAAVHPLYDKLRSRKHPGLVLFTSGTSGEPKGAVHDFTFLLEKFWAPRSTIRTLNFLLFDHWGGLNTMLHALSNGSAIISVNDRSPHAVARLIEKHKIELLPATPTFLNLFFLSHAHEAFDLSSLKVISYGAEPMTQTTLDRLKEIFPAVKLQQTYGLIEVGVLRSKSRDDGSLWVKLGGDGYELRVVEGILQIKTKSTILGYLNAPTPVTEDGWFITGDAVEQEGEYFRIFGRKSELINVGGEKVYPAEVENTIQLLPEVEEAKVYGEKNPLFGNVVCALVKVKHEVDTEDIGEKIKIHCRKTLPAFMVPVKIRITEDSQHNDRFKKTRV